LPGLLSENTCFSTGALNAEKLVAFAAKTARQTMTE
jgi:hypothetical protein